MIYLNGTTNNSLEPKVFVLHENEDWVIPLYKAMEEQHIPYEDWYIDQGLIDISSIPPEGVFYNRMSASSHTRNHRFSVELTGPILAWLESNNRRVINNRRALQLEVRKFEQYLALSRYEIKTPRTIAANDDHSILEAAKKFNGEPFIIKPNRGGKGAGVHLFYSADSLRHFLSETSLEEFTLDGIVLVQQYIKPVDQSITRMEFINGKFYYAVRVDTSEGFELCPADACQVNDDFCPTTDNQKFQLMNDFQNPDIPKCEAFLSDNGIEIGAIEFVTNDKGERFVYDVNINTNYNAGAEEKNGNTQRGMWQIAKYLGQELSVLQQSKHSIPA